ncbi:hypothetical protein SDC9_185364 [bioreactor metagenome]|uniref:Uncharacterized protein n=1 Tax=bioreactor metagenome TaxID=1076179 RepID=A0A645HR62_9ZZZZ
MSGIMFILVQLAMLFFQSNEAQLLIGVLFGIFIYITLSVLFKNNELSTIIALIKNRKETIL